MEIGGWVAGSRIVSWYHRSRVMPVEGRGLHSNGLSEDTSTVLRNGGIGGNKIRKDSRNIGDNAEARVHFSVPFDKC